LEKRTTNEYLVPARQLYDQIVRPIEPVLTAHHVDTLVVVPDEVLRIVPFAALYDGSGFLVDHYATAIAPSLKLVEPKPLTPGAGTALVLGISQSVQGYVDLPNVQQEVASVHTIEGGDVLLNDAFTRSRFASDLKSARYNVVHIASHGQFGADPSQSFVLAFDGPLTMDDLEADIKYGSVRENPLELLILSACETASGDDRAALGLAGVALKAGARSALATLWYVNDVASGALVTDFYKALQSGQTSRAQALRAAQRELAADPRFRGGDGSGGMGGGLPAVRTLARGRARPAAGACPGARSGGAAGLQAAAARRARWPCRRRLARHDQTGDTATDCRPAGARGSHRADHQRDADPLFQGFSAGELSYAADDQRAEAARSNH